MEVKMETPTREKWYLLFSTKKLFCVPTPEDEFVSSAEASGMSPTQARRRRSYFTCFNTKREAALFERQRLEGRINYEKAKLNRLEKRLELFDSEYGLKNE